MGLSSISMQAVVLSKIKVSFTLLFFVIAGHPDDLLWRAIAKEQPDHRAWPGVRGGAEKMFFQLLLGIFVGAGMGQIKPYIGPQVW